MMQRSPERQAVLDVIISASGPIGPQDIAARTGMRPVNVRALLQGLVKECVVRKAAYGKYTADFPALKPSSAPRRIDELHPRRVGWLKD